MKTYKIEIEEIRKETVAINAKTEKEAIEAAYGMYMSELFPAMKEKVADIKLRILKEEKND